MKISVAMTTYNGMRYIEKQLDSLRMQRRSVDEVIIIDDCSYDGTYGFLKEYVKRHSLDSWIVKKNEVNLGYIRNFTSVLSMCTGDIIFTCDQDDIWCEDKICKMSEIMEQDTGILLMSSGICFIDSDGNRIDRQYIPYHMKNPIDKGMVRIAFHQILEKNFFPGCTMAVRADIVHRLCSTENNGISHDWALALMAAARNGLVWYNEPLIYYRIHENNTLGLASAVKGRLQYIKYMIDDWENYCGDFEKRVVYTEKNLELASGDLARFNRIAQFGRLRGRIVLGDGSHDKKSRYFIGRCGLYMREVMCYIRYLKGLIDKKGLAIDCIYVFKKRKCQ